VENLDSVENTLEMAQTVGGGEVPTTSDDERRLSSLGRTNDSLDRGASNDQNSWTYNFEASTITLGRIKEMVGKGYFVDDEARAPRAEAVLEPEDNEVVVYEDFFIASLCMPLHLVLACILLKFQA
jgi:hypothetical protein